MGTVLGDLLPLAVGVSISPIPIVAVILLLLSHDSARAGAGFAAGWAAGIVAVTVVVVLLANTLGATSAREPSAAVSWIKVALGVLLLVLAAVQWRGRSAASTPGWMRAIDGLTPIRAAGTGAVLAVANPKNLLLCVSAGVGIGGADIGAGAKVVAVAVFAIIAAVSVVAIVLGYLLAADRLRDSLTRAQRWLEANNRALLAVVLLVMGTVVLGKGIGGL